VLSKKKDKHAMFYKRQCETSCGWNKLSFRLESAEPKFKGYYICFANDRLVLTNSCENNNYFVIHETGDCCSRILISPIAETVGTDIYKFTDKHQRNYAEYFGTYQKQINRSTVLGMPIYRHLRAELFLYFTFQLPDGMGIGNGVEGCNGDECWRAGHWRIGPTIEQGQGYLEIQSNPQCPADINSNMKWKYLDTNEWKPRPTHFTLECIKSRRRTLRPLN